MQRSPDPATGRAGGFRGVPRRAAGLAVALLRRVLPIAAAVCGGAVARLAVFRTAPRQAAGLTLGALSALTTLLRKVPRKTAKLGLAAMAGIGRVARKTAKLALAAMAPVRKIPGRAAGFGLVGLLAAGGVALLVAAFTTSPPRPPQPAAAAAPTFLRQTPSPSASPSASTSATPGAPEPAESAATTTPGPDGTPTAEDTPAGMERSQPVKITIPKIGVDASILSLGLRKNGTIQVPPAAKAHRAGWYKLGPTPGEVGNSVIVGHVDSARLGSAVFFRLGQLRPGNIVRVTREDGSVARFVVNGVKAYPKAKFPTDLVYGDSDQAGLRLVTCGGPWTKANSYRDNVIAFATLIPPGAGQAG